MEPSLGPRGRQKLTALTATANPTQTAYHHCCPSVSTTSTTTPTASAASDRRTDPVPAFLRYWAQKRAAKKTNVTPTHNGDRPPPQAASPRATAATTADVA